MLDTIFGLPMHPLIVHATVVIVPTAAATVLLAAFWPRFRAWAGVLPAALSLVAVVLTPLSTSSGESLEETTRRTELVREHAEMGGLLIWWVVPLAVVAVGSWWLHRQRAKGVGVRWVLPALAVVLALGTLVQVALIGHSGAKAAWGETTPSASSGASAGH
jgi:uncharacterized membrane protein